MTPPQAQSFALAEFEFDSRNTRNTLSFFSNFINTLAHPSLLTYLFVPAMSPPKRRRIAEDEVEEETSMVVAMPRPDPILPEFDEIAGIVLDDLQKNDSDSVAAGLDKLFTLLQSRGKKNQRKAYHLGAHSIIATVMRRWPIIEDIQACGCQCLGMLAFYKTVPVVKSGGVEAVVYAMKAFPISESVQSGGCCTLMNTLSGCDSKSQAVKRVTYRFVKEMDGIPLILKALERFLDEDDVRQCGLGVFHNISLDKVLTEAMAKAGVLNTAVGILARYPEDEHVQEYTANIMTSMFG